MKELIFWMVSKFFCCCSAVDTDIEIFLNSSAPAVDITFGKVRLLIFSPFSSSRYFSTSSLFNVCIILNLKFNVAFQIAACFRR